MSTVYLIRHADAGDPWEYPKDDNKRPLSRFGREQSKDMGNMIKGFGIRHVFSSPAERCLQTVQAFHRVFRAEIETTQILAPSRINVVTPFMRTIPQETVLVCTHSDNIYAFLRQIHDEEGVAIPKRIVVPSGSFYVLERTGAIYTSVTYVPPDTPPPAPPKEDDADDVWVE